VVPGLLRTFTAEHPDLSVSADEYGFDEPTAGLRDHEVDVAIVRPPIGLTGLVSTDLLIEPRVACLPQDHRLATRTAVRVADLLDEPIVAAPESPGPWRDYWILSDHRSSPARIVAEASTFEAELQLVGRGVGISVTAMTAARWYRRPGVVFVPIVDLESCRVALAWWPETTCDTNAERSLGRRSSLMRCCVRDGGSLALRCRPAGDGIKPPHAALAEDRRGERCGKGGGRAVRWGSGRRTQVNRC
jgi:DNA-binding transcriptional LysR family regulator